MHTFTRNALSLVRFTDHTLLKSAVLILGLCLCTLASYAQAPNLINFQAQLADGGTLPSTITATFSIFDRSTGGSALWTEEQTIMQTNGAFNVLLGSVTSFPATLFSSSGERYLQVEVNGQQTGARFQLSSVAYALRAEAADRTGPTGIRFPDGSLQTTAATGSGGSSPWSASGSNVFYNAGNIGIGTSNPEGRLDIDDAFKFQTHNIGNGNQSMRLFFDENDAGGSSSGKWGFSFIHAGDNDDTHIFNGTTFSLPRNHFYILNHEDNSQGEVALSISRVNGNVGIGTTSPANAFLDIEPSANATARPLVYAGTPAANDWRSQNVAEFRSGPSASYTGTVLTASARRGDDANYNLLKLSNNLRNTESTKFLVRGDGNVGIGTTNPQTPLHVIGTVGINGAAIIADENGNKQTTIYPYGVDTEEITADTGHFWAGGSPVLLHTTNDAVVINSGAFDAPDLVFENISGKEWRVDMFSTPTTFLRFGSVSTSGSYNSRILFRDNGNVLIDGTLSEGSDRRLKTDIVPLEPALQQLLALQPVRYRFRPETERSMEPQIGLIAQEVEQAFPELVSEDEDGFLSLAYPKLTAVLLKGMQEQQAQIEAQQVQLETLMKRLQVLEQLASNRGD